MFSFFKKSADADTAPATASPPELSWRERLKAGLTRTREQWGGKLKSIFAHGRVDDELLGMVSMRRVLKSADGDLLDGLDVVGTFGANMHRHVELEMA